MASDEQRGYRVLSGAYGTLHLDGEYIFNCTDITADVEENRSDVQRGLDLDSKMVSGKGSGTFKVDSVYTRAEEAIMKAYKEGKDKRFVLSIAVNDPDAVGGQRTRTDIGNVWVDKLTVATFTAGEIVGKEFSFGFTPSDVNISEGIH